MTSGLSDWARLAQPVRLVVRLLTGCAACLRFSLPPPSLPFPFPFFPFSFFPFPFLFIHETHTHTHTHTHTEREREAETQAEGEAGSMQGARRGTQSWVSRITPWAEGGTKPLSHPGCPLHPFSVSVSLKKRKKSPLTFLLKNSKFRDIQVAQRLGICLWLRAWSRSPGIESHIGFPARSLLLPCLCLSVSLSLSLPVSLKNKVFKKK